MWWRGRKRAAHEPSTRAYGRLRLYADTVEDSGTVIDKKDDGQVYEVSWVRTEAAALDYLRGRDVRRERYYVIVETPVRNFGRDMIMIFDEADGTPIEIPPRTPLAEPAASATHCARCGYPVLPSSRVEFPCDGDPDCGHPWHTADFAQSAEEVIGAGLGYRCVTCRSAACRACYEATGDENRARTHGFVAGPDDERPKADVEIVHRLCWICRSPVTILDG